MFYLRMDLGVILSLSAPFMFLFLFSIMAMGKATVKTLEMCNLSCEWECSEVRDFLIVNLAAILDSTSCSQLI